MTLDVGWGNLSPLPVELFCIATSLIDIEILCTDFNARSFPIISLSACSEGSEGLQPVCDGASEVGIFVGTMLVTFLAVTGFNSLFV